MPETDAAARVLQNFPQTRAPERRRRDDGSYPPLVERLHVEASLPNNLFVTALSDRPGPLVVSPLDPRSTRGQSKPPRARLFKKIFFGYARLHARRAPVCRKRSSPSVLALAPMLRSPRSGQWPCCSSMTCRKWPERPAMHCVARSNSGSHLLHTSLTQCTDSESR